MKSIFVVVKAVHQHSGSSTWLEQRELDEFDTYEEAEDYIDSLTDEGDYQIAKVFRQSLEDAIKRQKEKIDISIRIRENGEWIKNRQFL